MKHKVSELEGALLDAGHHHRFKHGATIDKKPRSYICWEHMKARCNNPKDKRFHRYGGRGIKVCDRWNEYAAFAEDMGEPKAGQSIERISVDGNYEPGNCRWATKLEQANNTSKTIWVMFRGERASLSEWSRRIGLPYRTVWMRYAAGKTGEQLFAPINAVKSKAAKAASKFGDEVEL